MILKKNICGHLLNGLRRRYYVQVRAAIALTFIVISAGQISWAQSAALVEVTEVVEKEVLNQITLVGTAEPWLLTVVAAEEPGLEQKMLLDEGDHVTSRQALCLQDASQLLLTIDASRAALAEAEIQQRRAQREWERQERLYNINTVSEKAYDDARFESEAAQKRVASSEATLKALEDRLTKKTIRAPFSGYVVKRHALVGEWLDKGNPVATLVTLDPVRFIVQVPERYISLVIEGNHSEIHIDALPEKIFEGVIKAVIPLADEATRAFPVRIEVPNAEGVIKAGMVGRATLPVGKPYRAIMVPKDALVLSGAGAVVYTVNDEQARLVPVTTGQSRGPLVEVEGDLNPGSKVVLRGNEGLNPGQPVQIIGKE